MDYVDQDRLLDEAMIETRRRWGWSEERIDEFQRERTRDREELRQELAAELREREIMEYERRHMDRASGRAMLDLRIPAVSETRERDCAVCYEEFREGGKKLRTMPCGHSFHQRCIFDRLRFNRRCPVCRFAMTFVEEQRAIDRAQAEAAVPSGDGPEAAKRRRLDLAAPSELDSTLVTCDLKAMALGQGLSDASDLNLPSVHLPTDDCINGTPSSMVLPF
ncbi:probable E3 ubiquitin-protein ligase plr-1 [Triticum aestivum]|nr:probable E3 ubiquitin-protein ligase plr-1 [Triticum aestivum]